MSWHEILASAPEVDTRNAVHYHEVRCGRVLNEVKVPGLTVQQLMATADITERVQAGEDRSAILDEFKEKHPDLKHEVVSLYQGGMYQVYSYKIWDDLRLVCAPHGQSAHFGGDPDNFCYPRWGLDFTFVRAYENGKPVDSKEHCFNWRTEGANEGEPVFVTGNPGRTGRLKTLAQYEYIRDHDCPTLVPLY